MTMTFKEIFLNSPAICKPSGSWLYTHTLRTWYISLSVLLWLIWNAPLQLVAQVNRFAGALLRFVLKWLSESSFCQNTGEIIQPHIGVVKSVDVVGIVWQTSLWCKFAVCYRDISGSKGKMQHLCFTAYTSCKCTICSTTQLHNYCIA